MGPWSLSLNGMQFQTGSQERSSHLNCPGHSLLPCPAINGDSWSSLSFGWLTEWETDCGSATGRGQRSGRQEKKHFLGIRNQNDRGIPLDWRSCEIRGWKRRSHDDPMIWRQYLFHSIEPVAHFDCVSLFMAWVGLGALFFSRRMEGISVQKTLCPLDHSISLRGRQVTFY